MIRKVFKKLLKGARMVLSCKISFTPLHFFPTNIIPRMFFLPFHRSTFNLHILLTGKGADAPCLAYARKKKKKLADPLHLPALVCLSWMWTGRRSAICSSSPSDVRGRRAGPERKRRKRHILAAAPLSRFVALGGKQRSPFSSSSPTRRGILSQTT